MIARIFVLLLLMIILSDIYIDRRLLRRLTRYLWWQRLLWWTPGIVLFIYTLVLTFSRDFAPERVELLNVYLFLFGVLAIPKFLFAICSILGWGHCRFHHTKNNWGNLVGFVLAIAQIVIIIYGSTIGFRRLDIRHEDFYSPDVPAEFDGYRIVQFSDAHLGTYRGSSSKVLKRIIDSINAQKPDLIVFTGDLQNMAPDELYDFIPLLSSLYAKDGVCSILGNHDYSDYIKADDVTKVANERELISREREFGWSLLLNDNKTIKRGNDSIIVAGLENDGRKGEPKRADIGKALAGVDSRNFVLMLAHDPRLWRRDILPNSRAQLTLSGHTHAMQFEIFGWSPASLMYDEWGGMYHEGNRALNVSVGMGGFIPFRIGASHEIVVITLHRKNI